MNEGLNLGGMNLRGKKGNIEEGEIACNRGLVYG